VQLLGVALDSRTKSFEELIRESIYLLLQISMLFSRIAVVKISLNCSSIPFIFIQIGSRLDHWEINSTRKLWRAVLDRWASIRYRL
jgi:hypothetical protein